MPKVQKSTKTLKDEVNIKSCHIHIKGQVQGVGFRPFVYRLAKELKINGWVNNTTDGVHIVFNATTQQSLSFYDKIIQKAPILSKITEHSISETVAETSPNGVPALAVILALSVA